MPASFHVVDAILVCVLLDLPLVLAMMGYMMGLGHHIYIFYDGSWQ